MLLASTIVWVVAVGLYSLSLIGQQQKADLWSTNLLLQQLSVVTTTTTRYGGNNFDGGGGGENCDRQPQREADGCYHVFLDVGANIGVHGRFLLEPGKYPLATKAHEMFDKWYGPPGDRDNRDICVFAFEPNPRHVQALEEKSAAYAKVGWRFVAKNVGVSDVDANMTFYKMRKHIRNEDWGFTARTIPELPPEQVLSETVPVIRFSTWLEENVYKRKVPSKPYGTYEYGEPRVVMKLDVEHSEYVVVPDLITTGTFCRLAFVFGEFHPNGFQFEGQPVQNAGPLMRTSMTNVVANARNCKTVWRQIDDETYLHDGVPLPAA